MAARRGDSPWLTRAETRAPPRAAAPRFRDVDAAVEKAGLSVNVWAMRRAEQRRRLERRYAAPPSAWCL